MDAISSVRKRKEVKYKILHAFFKKQYEGFFIKEATKEPVIRNDHSSFKLFKIRKFVGTNSIKTLGFLKYYPKKGYYDLYIKQSFIRPLYGAVFLKKSRDLRPLIDNIKLSINPEKKTVEFLKETIKTKTAALDSIDPAYLDDNKMSINRVFIKFDDRVDNNCSNEELEIDLDD